MPDEHPDKPTENAPSGEETVLTDEQLEGVAGAGNTSPTKPGPSPLKEIG